MITLEPDRILLVRLSHLGDVVHAVPVLHGLRRRWPQAQIAWVCQNEFAPLLHGLPGLDRVIGFQRRAGLQGVFNVRRSMMAWNPELAVDAQGNLKSGLMTRLSGADHRLGLHASNCQESWNGHFMTDHAGPAKGVHAVDKAQTLLEVLGIDTHMSFNLGLTDEELSAGRDQRLRFFKNPATRAVMLHLGHEGDPRTWPSESFAELASALARRGQEVLILAGPSERETGEQLRRQLAGQDRIHHWPDQDGLRSLAGFFAVAAEEGDTFVGCDSGPSHIAAACGLGVRLLSGPQDPELTGPWPPAGRAGSPHRIVRPDSNRLRPITELPVEQVLREL